MSLPQKLLYSGIIILFMVLIYSVVNNGEPSTALHFWVPVHNGSCSTTHCRQVREMKVRRDGLKQLLLLQFEHKVLDSMEIPIAGPAIRDWLTVLITKQ
jgi:hypothetical protein